MIIGMGRYKLPRDRPCKHGHTTGWTPHGHCRTCRRLMERKRNKKPQWLRKEGLTWIASSQIALRKRRTKGQPCASKRELHALWVAQQGKCALTGLVIEGVPHLDHKVPVAAGGGHMIDNLQWVSPAANMAKLDRSVAEFEQWLLAAADSLRAKKQLEALL